MPQVLVRSGSAAIAAVAVTAAGLVLIGGVAVAADLSEPATQIEDGRVVMVLDDTETSSLYVPKGGEPTPEFPADVPEVGDAFTFTDDLRQDGALVGTNEGTCTVMPENAISCVATLTFAGGTVRVSGPVDEGEDESAASIIGITGGTGDYAGVRGTLTIADETDEDDPTDTLSTLTLRYLLPPETTQIAAVPVGAAATGGGAQGADTDAVLLVGVGIAAVLGSLGLFGAAHAAGRRD